MICPAANTTTTPATPSAPNAARRWRSPAPKAGKPARRPRRNLELLQDLFERIGLPLDIAGFQAAFYKLVGPDHPDARRAGTAAGDWIRAVGTHHLRTVLADGLPTNAAASETA